MKIIIQLLKITAIILGILLLLLLSISLGFILYELDRRFHYVLLIASLLLLAFLYYLLIKPEE